MDAQSSSRNVYTRFEQSLNLGNPLPSWNDLVQILLADISKFSFRWVLMLVSCSASRGFVTCARNTCSFDRHDQYVIEVEFQSRVGEDATMSAR